MRAVFVYGTLRKGERNYKKYIDGISTQLAHTTGSLFHIQNKNYPALIDGQDTITGEVLFLDAKQIAELNVLENYHVSDVSRSEYILTEINIVVDRKPTKAHSYLYNLKSPYNVDDVLKYVSSGDWLSR